MTTPAKPFPLPINYFGMVLGLAASGLAWRYGAERIGLPVFIGEGLLALAGMLWLWFVFAYCYKWCACRTQAREELRHPILGCFVSLIPITTILMGMGALPYSLPAANMLIGLGVVGQLAFSAYRGAGLWQGTHPREATTPGLYLPTVATNFVSATALGLLGYNDWGMIFFGAGAISWFMLEPAVLCRLRNLSPFVESLRPLLGIQLAPAFVGCSAYLAVNGGEPDWIVKVLIGYGLLQVLFLARLLPWIAAKGFSMSFWAFSFGLAAMANVGVHLSVAGQGHCMPHFGLAMFCVANACIGVLILATLKLAVNGRFFVK